MNSMESTQSKYSLVFGSFVNELRLNSKLQLENLTPELELNYTQLMSLLIKEKQKIPFTFLFDYYTSYP